VPYIKERLQFDNILNQFEIIPTKGDLEYCIFKLMKIYMKDKKISYSELHNTVYAAIHCGHEFERRFLDKRESEALVENGDVEC
jgi:hypothetical protein